MAEPHTDSGDIRPRPDPTVLTTEQSDRLRKEMLREVARAETLLRTELKAYVREIRMIFAAIEERRVEQKQDLKETMGKIEATIKELDAVRRRDVEEIKGRLEKIEQQYVTRDSVEARMSSLEFGAPRRTRE